MKEIELKILEINKDKVEAKLLELGAKKIFEGKVEAHYFSNNKLKEKGSFLRLRKIGDKVELTFKTKSTRKEVTQRDEYETYISSFDKAQTIIEHLGLKKSLIIKKDRISYKLNETRFELDKYHEENEDIPWFLEIESKDIKTIYSYVDKLNLPRENCLAEGFKGLRKHYNTKL